MFSLLWAVPVWINELKVIQKETFSGTLYWYLVGIEIGFLPYISWNSYVGITIFSEDGEILPHSHVSAQ